MPLAVNSYLRACRMPLFGAYLALNAASLFPREPCDLRRRLFTLAAGHGAGQSGAAVLLVLGSCTSLQAGAALAMRLFPVTGTPGATLLRLGLAAVVLLGVARPRVRGWRPWQWRAFRLAKQLHEEIHFDVAHQLTLQRARLVAGLAEGGRPGLGLGQPPQPLIPGSR